MWPDLIQKSKDGGLDVIETYVFWNGHEPEKNKVGSVLGLCFLILLSELYFFNIFGVKLFLQYNFEGRYDLVKFVKLAAKAGLYVHLRIGPYACAEWNYG